MCFKGSSISQRWIFVIMAFLGFCIGSGLRIILSITITEMVTTIKESTNQNDNQYLNLNRKTTENGTMTSMRYDWDEYTQGIILSSFFWGYLATQWFFGSISERYGGKYFLGQGIFIPAILTLFTPLAISYGGSTALIILRVLMGLANGSMYPAGSVLIAKWIVPAERTKMGNAIYAGPLLGAAFGTVIPALMIRYLEMGWEVVFYFFGALGSLWFPFWMILCYDNPEDHPFISDEELHYLQENLVQEKQNKPSSPPWKQIVTSKQMWAFAIALAGTDWAYFTVASDLPKYMNSIVGFSIESNGYLSALPYLSMWINTILSAWMIDQILQRKWMSITNVRKLFTTIALTGTALFMLGASYAERNQTLVVIMFILSMTMNGSSYPSIVVNVLDLSPNYAGTLMSLGNSIGALGGIISPYVVGVLVNDQTIEEWRQVFWIVFGISTVGNVCYLIWGSAEVQKWDDPDTLKDIRKSISLENQAIKLTSINSG